MIQESSSVGRLNPRVPVRFKNERAQKVYQQITKRIEVHQRSADEAEAFESFGKMVDRISRMEELDWVVAHLKRLFSFEEIEEDTTDREG